MKNIVDTILENKQLYLYHFDLPNGEVIIAAGSDEEAYKVFGDEAKKRHYDDGYYDDEKLADYTINGKPGVLYWF
jgi:hypothetical protein